MEANNLLSRYGTDMRVWDEMFGSEGIRPAYRSLVEAIQNLSAAEMTHKDELAKCSL